MKPGGRLAVYRVVAGRWQFTDLRGAVRGAAIVGGRYVDRAAHESARCDIAVDIAFAQTELAKHSAGVFALEGRLAERLEFFAREPPRTGRQAVGPAIAV